MKKPIISNSQKWKEKGLYFAAIFLIIIMVIGLLPKERIINTEAEYNYEGCNYYISLQSLLANYPLLSNDDANLRLIKDRLIKFESDLTSTTLSTAYILTNYKLQYSNLLKTYGINSISSMTNAVDILAIAKKASYVVDNFYLDSRIYCINPLYDWSKHRHRRVLRYNLSGLYGKISNKYSFILSAISDDWLTGSAPGLFTINQSTVLDTRYMSGLPLLTALYVLPKYNFERISQPNSAAPWNFFRASSFIDSVTRKILNISGVDYFTVEKKDLFLKKIPAVVHLKSYINKTFDYGLTTFFNTQSYGLAYLAENISYENASEINKDELEIKKYFHHNDHPEQFIAATNRFYQKLLQLKNKHDIILESMAPKEWSNQSQFYSASGSVKIKGIVGERALFVTHCLKYNCIFVFNAAYSKGWHAYVNNVNSGIERANFSFMATTVPRGNAYVWFIYEPWSRIIGDFMSIISLIVCIFIVNRLIR
ncbi:MAG: Bacterial rane protein YfhO [Gammaproteobacteria bacterium]|jgi:hypothetical protein|nr:Bacterial rane protein YfhO [Gammaproteobacteria bacterium]